MFTAFTLNVNMNKVYYFCIYDIKKLLISCPTAMVVLKLIMPYNDGNVDKKFQPPILSKNRENYDYGQTD